MSVFQHRQAHFCESIPTMYQPFKCLSKILLKYYTTITVASAFLFSHIFFSRGSV